MRARFTAYSAARASALILEGWFDLASLQQPLNNFGPLWEMWPAIPASFTCVQATFVTGAQRRLVGRTFRSDIKVLR